MSLSHLPLPSIAQVLVSNQPFIPLVRVDDKPAPLSNTHDFMQSIDDRQTDPLERRHLSYIYRTGPATAGPRRAPKRRFSKNDILSMLSTALRKVFILRMEDSLSRQRQ